MRRPKLLPAFTPDEQSQARQLLATQVIAMGHRKLEEGDWTRVYCLAKGIEEKGWSNLKLDVVHGALGLEHKMLRVLRVREMYGKRLMHPSLTRSIRISSGTTDPDAAMRSVLQQYSEFLDQRKSYVRKQSNGQEPELRTGWLLWENELRDFLYFEEETVAPDPSDYYAEWHESPGGGGRKGSRNLWIYEHETHIKRFSVTTDAGAKIQPYFDVPLASAPHTYLLTAQGEELGNGQVRIWLGSQTARELRRLAPDLGVDALRVVIESAASRYEPGAPSPATRQQVQEIRLPEETYGLLTSVFPGTSDDERVKRLIEYLSDSKQP